MRDAPFRIQLWATRIGELRNWKGHFHNASPISLWNAHKKSNQKLSAGQIVAGKGKGKITALHVHMVSRLIIQGPAVTASLLPVSDTITWRIIQLHAQLMWESTWANNFTRVSHESTALSSHGTEKQEEHKKKKLGQSNAVTHTQRLSLKKNAALPDEKYAPRRLQRPRLLPQDGRSPWQRPMAAIWRHCGQMQILSATMTAARWGAGRQDGPLTMATANPRTRLIPRTEYDGSSSMY